MSMNYKRLVVTGLILAVVFPALASAQSAGASLNATVTPAKTRADVRANIDLRRASATEEREARRANVKQNIDDRKATATARRIEVQQNIAKRQVEHVRRVMLATIERLETIIERIESRIAKHEAEGKSVGESKEFVAAAKANLLDAKVKVEAFSSVDLSSDKAQDNFQRIRAAAGEARDLIKEARQNLMNAIRSLVSGKSPDDDSSDDSDGSSNDDSDNS